MKRIGKYEVEGILARGGSARVWAIRSEKGESLAFKSIDIQGVDARNDFLREVSVLRQLTHPRIVQICDVILTKEHMGAVMPRAFGSLENWLQIHGKLPPRLAVVSTIALLEALEFAHSKGILHRDIKPGNVLVFGDGDIKLCDFGAALDLDTPESMTSTGVVLGTLPYLAPERRRGHGATVASDIYGVGATLAHLLTGSTPGDLYASDWIDELRPSIPGELVDVLERAGMHQPTARFESAKAMRETLESILVTLPLTEGKLMSFQTRIVPVTQLDTRSLRPVESKRTSGQRIGGVEFMAGLSLALLLFLVAFTLVRSENTAVNPDSLVEQGGGDNKYPIPECEHRIVNLLSVVAMGPRESLRGAFGDFNGDGRKDLVLMSLVDEALSLYSGGGCTDFGTSTVFPGTRSAVKPSVCDLNRDGLDDVVAVLSEDSSYRLYEGDKVRGLIAGQEVCHKRPPEQMGLADVNGDGGGDLSICDLPTACLGVRTGLMGGNSADLKCLSTAFP